MHDRPKGLIRLGIFKVKWSKTNQIIAFFVQAKKIKMQLVYGMMPK